MARKFNNDILEEKKRVIQEGKNIIDYFYIQEGCSQKAIARLINLDHQILNKIYMNKYLGVSLFKAKQYLEVLKNFKNEYEKRKVG